MAENNLIFRPLLPISIITESRKKVVMNSQIIEKIKKYRYAIFTKMVRAKDKDLAAKYRWSAFVLDDLLEHLARSN